METYEVNVGLTYSGKRWKGCRKVTDVKRHRGQETVVYFVDLRTKRNGHSLLKCFARNAYEIATDQA